VLGIPISACGLLFGILGSFVSLGTLGVRLRWSLAGLALSAVALGINIAIAYAPSGYQHEREVPKAWQPPPGRPYVPPPSQ
jgi:hypothetical protein